MSDMLVRSGIELSVPVAERYIKAAWEAGMSCRTCKTGRTSRTSRTGRTIEAVCLTRLTGLTRLSQSLKGKTTDD